MNMSRLTLITVFALAFLLLGATVVYAQNQPPGYGRSMMQTQGVAPTQTTPDQTPGSGNVGNGTCPLGGSTGGMGGMMNSDEMKAAHQAMQNGDWNAMSDACRKAWDRNQTSNGQNQPSSTNVTPTAPGTAT